MNIAMFTDTYLPHLDGTVINIENIKNELLKRGHQVYVFAPREPGFTITSDNIYQFVSLPLLFQPEYRFALPLTNHTLRIVRKLGINIIHTHIPFPVGVLGSYVAKKLRLPLVHTYNILFKEFVRCIPIHPNLLHGIVKRTSRIYCNLCDLVIAPSNGVKKLLCSYGVMTRIEVLPSGINSSMFSKSLSKSIRDKHNLPRNAKILLYVGRLSVEKNIDFLIKSFKRVNDVMPNTYLLIIGDGPRKRQLTRLSKKLRLEGKVLFVGWIPHGKVRDYYASADIFAFASTGETQGITIWEAKACRLPTVAVDAIGVRESIDDGHDGLLVPFRIEKFSENIAYLLRDKAVRERMSINAENNSLKLSSSKIVDRLITLYDELTVVH